MTIARGSRNKKDRDVATSCSVLLAVLSVLLTPASAQDWASYFNMDTFGAGGGSEVNGWLNFECADASSGMPTSGRAHLEMRPSDDVKLTKNQLQEKVMFEIDGKRQYGLPMTLSPGSDNDLTYKYSPQTTPIMLEFIAALRKGTSMTARVGNLELANIDLGNSSVVLKPIEDCTREGSGTNKSEPEMRSGPLTQ